MRASDCRVMSASDVRYGSSLLGMGYHGIGRSRPSLMKGKKNIFSNNFESYISICIDLSFYLSFWRCCRCDGEVDVVLL